MSMKGDGPAPSLLSLKSKSIKLTGSSSIIAVIPKAMKSIDLSIFHLRTILPRRSDKVNIQLHKIKLVFGGAL
jgi:hypothetical protein